MEMRVSTSMRCSGVGGLEAVHILGGKGCEVGGFFAADDFGSGVDAGFQGIHGGGGLAVTERGPVDFWALRRLAWNCLRVGIKKDRRGGLSNDEGSRPTYGRCKEMAVSD